MAVVAAVAGCTAHVPGKSRWVRKLVQHSPPLPRAQPRTVHPHQGYPAGTGAASSPWMRCQAARRCRRDGGDDDSDDDAEDYRGKRVARCRQSVGDRRAAARIRPNRYPVTADAYWCRVSRGALVTPGCRQR